LILNVLDFGGTGDGIHDDYNAIISAINSSSNLRVIFFPAGNYLIKSTISLPSNVILRGEGETSNLNFDLSSINSEVNCINVLNNNQPNLFTPVDSGYNKGSTFLTVANSNAFIVNGYAEIREANGSWDTISPGTYRVGQIVKINGIAGNVLNITPALRIDYTSSLHPEIRPFTPKQNVGIECIKINRIDSPVNNNYGRNVAFSFANNCWMIGVESNKTQSTHVSLSSCSHITISGCYIHQAFNYGGGGEGYGVNMIAHTSDCKVENCIFNSLAML
jgi:polygalacturonase